MPLTSRGRVVASAAREGRPRSAGCRRAARTVPRSRPYHWPGPCRAGRGSRVGDVVRPGSARAAAGSCWRPGRAAPTGKPVSRVTTMPRYPAASARDTRLAARSRSVGRVRARRTRGAVELRGDVLQRVDGERRTRSSGCRCAPPLRRRPGRRARPGRRCRLRRWAPSAGQRQSHPEQLHRQVAPGRADEHPRDQAPPPERADIRPLGMLAARAASRVRQRRRRQGLLRPGLELRERHREARHDPGQPGPVGSPADNRRKRAAVWSSGLSSEAPGRSTTSSLQTLLHPRGDPTTRAAARAPGRLPRRPGRRRTTAGTIASIRCSPGSA